MEAASVVEGGPVGPVWIPSWHWTGVRWMMSGSQAYRLTDSQMMQLLFQQSLSEEPRDLLNGYLHQSCFGFPGPDSWVPFLGNLSPEKDMYLTIYALDRNWVNVTVCSFIKFCLLIVHVDYAQSQLLFVLGLWQTGKLVATVGSGLNAVVYFSLGKIMWSFISENLFRPVRCMCFVNTHLDLT